VSIEFKKISSGALVTTSQPQWKSQRC